MTSNIHNLQSRLAYSCTLAYALSLMLVHGTANIDAYVAYILVSFRFNND